MSNSRYYNMVSHDGIAASQVLNSRKPAREITNKDGSIRKNSGRKPKTNRAKVRAALVTREDHKKRKDKEREQEDEVLQEDEQVRDIIDACRQQQEVQIADLVRSVVLNQLRAQHENNKRGARLEA